MKTSPTHRSGFTLIELLVVIAIIGMLVTLLIPVTTRVIDSANELKCTKNLTQLGIIIQTAATDGGGAYPAIENDPQNPIHSEKDGKVWTLPDLVKSRGGSVDILKCPADLKQKLSKPKGKEAMSYFDTYGSSYEWVPMFEGESVNAPRVFTPFGTRNIPPRRVRLLMDYVETGEAPHSRTAEGSTMHVFYADGSVRKVVITKQ
jgi:prepilin-type N-terminal cleavage/methylation domain-containing protein